MYNWRTMTDEQKEYVLKIRKEQSRPYHSLPHSVIDRDYYHLSAACYEHKPLIGHTFSRILNFENSLLKTICINVDKIFGYSFLPNHYHVLVKVNDIKLLLNKIFKFHRQSAIEWNKTDNTIGRKVWCNVMDTGIKGESHFWAVMNYIHNNPVKHGYVKKWQDWPFSSADDFIKAEGIKKTRFIWEKYDTSRMFKWDV